MSKRNRNRAAQAAAESTTIDAGDAQVETGAEVVEAKVAKPRKPLSEQGRGNPSAKKVINPQPTLELKKKLVRQAGGTMEYKNRQWEIEVNGESFVFPSRQLAGMTAGQLCAEVGVEIQG